MTLKKIKTSNNNNSVLLILAIVTIFTLIITFTVNDSYATEQQQEESTTTTDDNISDTLDSMIESYNDLESDRRELVTQLYNTDPSKENKIESIENKIEKKKSRMDFILEQVEELAPQEESYNPSVTNDIPNGVITTGTAIYAGSDHNACDSSSIPSSTNLNTGSISTDSDSIGWVWSIADSKSVGWFYPFCSNVYFEEITMITRNNTQQESCTTVSDTTTTGDKVQTCNCGIESNDLLSWLVETTYEPNSGTNTEGNDNWYGLHRVS